MVSEPFPLPSNLYSVSCCIGFDVDDIAVSTSRRKWVSCLWPICMNRWTCHFFCVCPVAVVVSFRRLHQGHEEGYTSFSWKILPRNGRGDFLRKTWRAIIMCPYLCRPKRKDRDRTGKSGNSRQEQHILGWNSAFRLCGDADDSLLWDNVKMDLSEYETVCQRVEKSWDGKPIRQVCIEREGQMFTICRAIPTYSCGACLIADNSLYFSRRTCYDARNTECCMPGCFSYCSSYTS